MFFVVENTVFFSFLQHVSCFVVGNATEKIKDLLNE